MRLFVALDLDDTIRDRILRFLDGVRGFAPDLRWVRPESLHVTLKFIGEQPEEKVDGIKRLLGTIECGVIEMNFHGHGFFPGTRAPRIFWMGIEGGPTLTSLAAAVNETLLQRNIPKEEHAYSPHLTLARLGASRSPRNRNAADSDGGFHRLQEKLTALPAPEFGTMTAREFFLYQSQPLPGGSKYTRLAGFALH